MLIVVACCKDMCLGEGNSLRRDVSHNKDPGRTILEQRPSTIDSPLWPHPFGQRWDFLCCDTATFGKTHTNKDEREREIRVSLKRTGESLSCLTAVFISDLKVRAVRKGCQGDGI